VLESAVYSIGAVQEFSLHPFDIAETGTVGELIEHTGGDQLRRALDGSLGIGGHYITIMGLVFMINKDIY
jgi:hypothetical protein